MLANASKIIRNWFLILQPIIISSLPKWAQFICLCTNLCTYLLMHLCERKKSFIKINTLILYLKLQTSFNCRFGILTCRILSGWVWNLTSFSCKLWEDLICEWYLISLTQVYYYWQSWNISCLMIEVLRHYKVALLLITKRDIQSVEKEILSAKVKPDFD